MIKKIKKKLKEKHMSWLTLAGVYLIVGAVIGLIGALFEIEKGKNEKEARKTFYRWTIGWLPLAVGIFFCTIWESRQIPPINQ